MNTKVYRKVNKVIPVFFREKGCIEKFFIFPERKNTVFSIVKYKAYPIYFILRFSMMG